MVLLLLSLVSADDKRLWRPFEAWLLLPALVVAAADVLLLLLLLLLRLSPTCTVNRPTLTSSPSCTSCMMAPLPPSLPSAPLTPAPPLLLSILPEPRI